MTFPDVRRRPPGQCTPTGLMREHRHMPPTPSRQAQVSDELRLSSAEAHAGVRAKNDGSLASVVAVEMDKSGWTRDSLAD